MRKGIYINISEKMHKELQKFSNTPSEIKKSLLKIVINKMNISQKLYTSQQQM